MYDYKNITVEDRMAIRKRALDSKYEAKKLADFKRFMRLAGNPTFTPDRVKVQMQNKYPEEDMDYIRGFDDGEQIEYNNHD